MSPLTRDWCYKVVLPLQQLVRYSKVFTRQEREVLKEALDIIVSKKEQS